MHRKAANTMALMCVRACAYAHVHIRIIDTVVVTHSQFAPHESNLGGLCQHDIATAQLQHDSSYRTAAGERAGRGEEVRW